MGIVKKIQEIGSETRNPTSLVRRCLKATEEVGELAEAALCVTSLDKSKGKTWEDVTEEAIDVAIMGIDIALSKPPGFGDVSDEDWRRLVTHIFDLKLKVWKHKLQGGKTTIHPGELEIVDRDKYRKVLENIDEHTEENMGGDLAVEAEEFQVNHFHGGHQLDPE